MKLEVQFLPIQKELHSFWAMNPDRRVQKQHLRAQSKSFSCEDVAMLNGLVVVEQGKLMEGWGK
jgi:hypothetical protein